MMSPHPAEPNRAAFTLIEVVLSAAIMALILVTAYLCMSSALASQRLVESRAEALQTARVAMSLISADLRAACPLNKEFDFLGQHRLRGGIENDQMDFATHNYRARHPGEADFCQMTYVLAPALDPSRLSLWRRRNPMIALDPLAGGDREEIATDAAGLRLEYYDGFDWHDDWGDPTGRAKTRDSLREHPNLAGLPKAVRITLWVKPAAHASVRRSDARQTGGPPIIVQTVARLNLSKTVWSGGDESGSPSPENNGAPAAPAPGNGTP